MLNPLCSTLKCSVSQSLFALGGWVFDNAFVVQRHLLALGGCCDIPPQPSHPLSCHEPHCLLRYICAW